MSLRNKPYYGPNNYEFPITSGLLLMRHSERGPIHNIPESYVVGLTEHGRTMAFQYGQKLGQKWTIGEAVASPVGRCMETCECLVRGAVNGTCPHPVVKPLNALHFEQKLTGVPGLAGVFLDDHGFDVLGSNPTTPEFKLLRQNLLTELPIPVLPGVLNIAVTHDVIVTFIMACLNELPSTSVRDFPGFLEGVVLVRDGDQIKLG